MTQRTKKDVYALINKGETFRLECKMAHGGLLADGRQATDTARAGGLGTLSGAGVA